MNNLNKTKISIFFVVFRGRAQANLRTVMKSQNKDNNAGLIKASVSVKTWI